ncbi:MAG TPA: F0F1 ATP synthase subunit B [Methylophilaceae bacterium]|jgi:F-type H+-transporting ATPase subunit b
MNINLTLFAQAVSFALLIWFTARFVWPPLLKAIETRQKTIADGLAAGERGKHELEISAKRAAEVLRDSKQQGSDIIAQAEKRASGIIDEAKAQAKVEADRIQVGAKAELEQEVFRAKEALRQQVAELAVAGAEKILRREIDAKAHADILNTVASQL